MNNILFNTHDMVLAVCILFYLFFAIANNMGRSANPTSRNLLTVFFLLNACAAFDTLVFWGDAVRYAAFAVSPWILMLFSFAAFALGPFFYWFFRALQSPEVGIKRWDYVQLLPALLAVPYVYWACLQYPLEQQRVLILNYSIFSDPQTHFFVFLTLKKLFPVVYGLKCIALLWGDNTFLVRRCAASRQMLFLYGGFVVLWLWGLAVHILGQSMPLRFSDSLGVVGNYLNLALLLVIWLQWSLNSPEAKQNDPGNRLTGQQPVIDGAAVAKDPEVDALASRIAGVMVEMRPYRNSQITLERFAMLLHATPRQVSAAINSCFNQNFHEYINRYRVEEAKTLLRDPLCIDSPILEVANQAGFNSKATFNRTFKQQVGVTPSQYRLDVMQPISTLGPQLAASQNLQNVS